MKKYANKIALMVAFFMAIAAVGHSQIVVKVRPEYGPVVAHRPPPPSPRHVWIEGEWTVQGNHYVKQPGYWSEPRRGYHRWVPGHWADRRGGSYWVPGHWVR